jgi:hypothetical protein
MLVVALLAGSVGFNLAADTPHEGASPHEH